jgi:hypothetical protein
MSVVSVVSSRRRRVQTRSRPQAVPAYRWEVTTPTTSTSARRCLAEKQDPKTEQAPLQAPAPALM